MIEGEKSYRGDERNKSSKWDELEKKLSSNGLTEEYRETIDGILKSENQVIARVLKYEREKFDTRSLQEFFNNLVFDDDFIEILEEKVVLDKETQVSAANDVIRETYEKIPDISEDRSPVEKLLKNFSKILEEGENGAGGEASIFDTINKRVAAINGYQGMIDRYLAEKTVKFKEKLIDEKKKLASLLIVL